MIFGRSGSPSSLNLVKRLNQYFQRKVKIPRIRMGNEQEIETLINEEALLLAMFLRNERKDWISRVEIMHTLKEAPTQIWWSRLG